MGVDRAVVQGELSSQRLLGELLALYGLTCGLEQTLQYFELGRGEFERVTVQRGASSARFESQRAILQNRIGLCLTGDFCGHCRGAAQYRADARQKFARIERFGQIVVCTEFEAEDAVYRFATCGEHHYREAGRAHADVAEQIEATAPRQHHIEDHEVRIGFGQLPHGGLAVAGDPRVQPLIAQELREHGGELCVIVDQQDPGLHDARWCVGFAHLSVARASLCRTLHGLCGNLSMTAGRIDVQCNSSRDGLSPPGLTFDGDWIMKKLILLATAAAMTGSAMLVAQMPPAPPAPPVPPGATVVMESPQGERREMRRIIIRGDEVGPRGMGVGGGMGMGAMGAIGAIGSFLDTRSVESMTRGLDLTPQQLGKMTEYVATARPEMRKLAEEMSAESRRLRELSPSDAKYATTSAEIAKRVGDLTGRLVEQNSALRAKVWGLLTPEQRIKAEIRAKEMRERAQERVRDLMKDRRFRGDGAERPSLMFFELERDDV